VLPKITKQDFKSDLERVAIIGRLRVLVELQKVLIDLIHILVFFETTPIVGPKILEPLKLCAANAICPPLPNIAIQMKIKCQEAHLP
jgi:hypothetical protein